jgi:hypothetical protein
MKMEDGGFRQQIADKVRDIVDGTDGVASIDVIRRFCADVMSATDDRITCKVNRIQDRVVSLHHGGEYHSVVGYTVFAVSGDVVFGRIFRFASPLSGYPCFIAEGDEGDWTKCINAEELEAFLSESISDGIANQMIRSILPLSKDDSDDRE